MVGLVKPFGAHPPSPSPPGEGEISPPLSNRHGFDQKKSVAAANFYGSAGKNPWLRQTSTARPEKIRGCGKLLRLSRKKSVAAANFYAAARKNPWL
jgi:hypothetical protein